jgi:hypothetical protein
METQPSVGIYDLGHNLADWVSGTPVQVSLETDMTGTHDGSDAATVSTVALDNDVVLTTNGVATFVGLRIPSVSVFSFVRPVQMCNVIVDHCCPSLLLTVVIVDHC